MDRDNDIVMMKGGRMVTLIDGEMQLMSNEMLAADGTMVRTDGTLLLPDGSTRVLLEDEALIIDLLATRMSET